MVWDIRNRRYEIAMLKVSGWKGIHVIEIFTIRIMVITIISGTLGLLFIVSLQAIFLSWKPNSYFFYLIVSHLLYQISIVMAVTLLFAIPTILIAYFMSAESAIRG